MLVGGIWDLRARKNSWMSEVWGLNNWGEKMELKWGRRQEVKR